MGERCVYAMRLMQLINRFSMFRLFTEFEFEFEFKSDWMPREGQGYPNVIHTCVYTFASAGVNDNEKPTVARLLTGLKAHCAYAALHSKLIK